jgi:salicylate hydroxylase
VQLRGREVMIVGAGVAGLAAARAMAMRGASVTVVERAPVLDDIGAGLQVSPNGARVLHALGLSDALCQASLRARAISLIDGISGRGVLRLDLPQGTDHPGFHLLHRADLVTLLARGAKDAGVEIRLGVEVNDVVLIANGARLHLSNGSIVAPCLTLGADGLQSSLRKALNGEAAPHFTGQVAWRAAVPADGDIPAVAEVHMGPGRHLVTYPLRGSERRNIVAVEERSSWTEEGWSLRDRPEAVREAFREFADPVRKLLAAADEVYLWGLFRHPVASRWWAPGVAILGDAAHPTLPFLAQGANMALEDAWVLAACMDRQGSDGLGRYQALRQARCSRIVAAANRNARAYHLRGPARRLAHVALRLGGPLAGRAAMAQLGWLYDHRVVDEI